MQTRSFKVPSEYSAIEKRVGALLGKVYNNAVKEVRRDQQVQSRVRAALENRFKPYILEAEIIAQQLLTPQYSEFKDKTRDFFAALVNVVACPDGRISVLSLTDPRAVYIHRPLRGQLPTRLTTSNKEVPIPANTDLRSGIWTNLKKLKRKNPKQKPKLVALIGPHIDSVHPTHGCGAAAAALSGLGSGLPGALATMHFGGARNYFRILEQSGEYSALNNLVAIAGGEGTTVDYTHDLHSQGVIIGLKHSYKELDERFSLRENLLRLQREKKLVMSELLVSQYHTKIINAAKKTDSDFARHGWLNYRDPLTFARNAVIIGEIAQALTQAEEKNDYSILPKVIKNGLDEVAARVVAYHLLRSVVYLVLGNIAPGKHWLIHHPEQLMRVGPIGADFNVATIAFIETTPPAFSATDLASAFALYGLMERFLPDLNVDLTKEARVIMVSGGFNPAIYKDEETIEEKYDQIATTVLEDAAGIKTMIKRAIMEGAAVVIPMIHHIRNRSIIDVVYHS